MCGIFGVCNSDQAAQETYYGLHAIQHRAQEYAGIVSSDGRYTYSHHGRGIVVDVFNQLHLRRLHGKHAVGHIRYRTVEDNPELENAQPIMAPAGNCNVVIAHNGNIVNIGELRERLGSNRWRTSLDTEVFLRQFCDSPARCFFTRIFDTVSGVRGSYSLIIMHGNLMAAVRDPYGNRPLWIGCRNGSYYFCSETVSLDSLGVEVVREVEPGEIVVVQDGMLRSRYFDETQLSDQPITGHKRAHCVFELLYFAQQASDIFGQSVQSFQFRAGELLQRNYPAPCANIVAIPDSAIFHAEGFASAAGHRLIRLILRSHYIGRTFIEPSQDSRISALVKKFSFVRSLIRECLVLIDDSIVRLNTLPRIVAELKSRGVKEIHVRIPTPPIRHSCYYGIDMPTQEHLVMAHCTVTEVIEKVGIASLEFLTVEQLRSLLPNPDDFCYACMTGEYPMGTPTDPQRN